ncbi:MAG: TniQ family protein, partial [Actinomycetia bacterium]|nr:TniQ family protein [Actinomycetes bacterium]
MSAARALPLRVDILPGESADSWLEALARRHGVSLRPTLAALGLQPPPVTVSRLLNRVPPAQWRQIEHATGLAPGRLDAATSTAWGAASSLQTPGSRFCPQCLLVHGGRWKLAWRLSCTVACPQHRILLAAACPACHHPPRRMVSRGPSPLPSASCAQLIEGVRCSARLTAATVVPIGAEILDAERWVQRLLLSRGSGPEQHQSQSELHDLPVVMSWLLRHHTEAMRVAADRLVPDWPQPPDPTAAPVLNEPAVTAAALVHAQAILGPEDRHALELLERLRGGPNGWPAACPPGIDPRRWGGLTSQFPSRYLRVVDHQLPSMDRLRFSSPTAAAALPTEVPGPAVSGRARLIPQLLWSGWTARLLPPTGIAADRLRVLTAGCLLLPGHTRASGAEELARFAPRLSAAAVAALLTSFARLSDGAFLDPVLTVLCRIAEHLDTAGPVIDYQRRRDRIPVATIGWQQWRELALTAGAHPGDRAQHGRHLQAKRYLYQLLSGADLSDPCHELSFRSGTDRSLYTRFETAVATPLRRALHAHAAAVLADLGIDEPVTWSPPPELAEGLRLPGVSNMDRLRELVAVTPGTPRQIAPLLDVHIEHVRIALEGAHRPARRWKTSAAPLVWQREQEAARKLTPSFFHRELRAGRNHIDDLAKAAGLSRGHIRRYAEKAGIN